MIGTFNRFLVSLNGFIGKHTVVTNITVVQQIRETWDSFNVTNLFDFKISKNLFKFADFTSVIIL